MTQDPTRKALSAAVNACRRVLVGDRKQKTSAKKTRPAQRVVDDIGAQLEAPYGFDPRTGAPAALDTLTHLKPSERGVAKKLRDWHAHLATSAAGATDADRARAAYDQLKYEIGYTALHRLCALRMIEARMAVAGSDQLQLVSRKRDSSGFKLYLQLAEGVSLGDLGRAFNFYLDRLYDEMGRSLPSVFDRSIAPSLLAPSPDAVEAMLDALMVSALDEAWKSEETLGWIFEDYNDPDERSEMREHDAPRNVRELAVRNQFFTPRWVVEFLTDNTLGRLWLERAGAETEVRDVCKYLPRDLAAPDATTPCDPRDLRVLDPACGSGHFLLYAYDLFEMIYREAWWGRVHRSPERKPLWEEFAEEERFLKEVPRLIVANNLYGVDIDPRCIQEAALSLWLRAHRSWQAQEIKYRERPAITSAGLVCAQAMPDAPELLGRLVEKLKPAVLGRLVSAIFTRAAEVGVLQRAESAIADTVADVKREYVEWKRAEKAQGQGELFASTSPPNPLSLSGEGEPIPETRGGEPDEESPRPGVVRTAVVFDAQLEAARRARREPTPAEERAWELLRNRRILGLKFRREQVINGLRVDLYCAALRLSVEIDGDVHDDPEQRERDVQRTLDLGRWGVRVVRIRNEDVSRESLEALLAPFVHESSAPAPPSPDRERGGGGVRSEFVELSSLGDATFWREAEGRVAGAIETLMNDAGAGEHFRNRLFAEELRHGLEFHELSRQRFDVILMNPPFGEPTEATKVGLDKAYPNAGHDLYAMFYERALEMLAPGGRVGAITNRAWLALPSLAEFRAEVLGQKGTVEVVADFGYGVLNAKVETAATVVRLGGDRDAHATWIRLVKTKRKADVLLNALTAGAAHPAVNVVPASRFDALPDRVCGYWMSESLASTYTNAQKFAAKAHVKQGTATADDFRFLRLAWEVMPAKIGLVKDWARFAKGGEYRPYFDDVHLVVRWEQRGREVAAYPKAYIRNSEYYGARGVTWPRRTNLRISPRVLSSGCAFGDKGPALMSSGDTPNAALLAVVNSAPSFLLLSVRLQTADASPQSISKSYEVGLIRDLPWPQLSEEARVRVARLANKAAETVRTDQIEDDDTGETVVGFVAPPVLLARPHPPLPCAPSPCQERGLGRPTDHEPPVCVESHSPDRERGGAAARGEVRSFEAAVRERVAAREDRLAELAAIQKEIDDLVASAYGFEAQDRAVMDEELEPALAALPGTYAIDEALFRTAYLTTKPLDGERLPGGLDAELDVRVEHRRGKQMRLRDEATLCRIFQAPPAKIAEVRRRLGLLRREDLQRAAADVVSYAVGVAFGRWDIRLVEHPEWIPTFADPFDPLPPCPLGQLVDAKGLPAVEGHIASEEWLAARVHPTEAPYGPFRGDDGEVTAKDYPVRVAWEGVLVDDVLDDALPRRPEDGFIARVEAVLERLLGAARTTWEQEICEALGVKDLAAWLRAPGGFFADHLGRYTKSRRQAPIYWPLSTASGGLTFWLYAPRFDSNTLARLVNHLRPNVENLRGARDAAQTKVSQDPGQSTRHEQLRREVEERQQVLTTLEALESSGYAPHPDDGYVVVAAPLRELFRYGKWREVLETTWREFQNGELDWSHLAMRFRREEVLKKCRTDRSLAIAHEREGLYVPPPPKTRKGKKGAAVKPATKKATVTTKDGATKGRKPKGAGGASVQLSFGDAPRKEEA